MSGAPPTEAPSRIPEPRPAHGGCNPGPASGMSSACLPAAGRHNEESAMQLTATQIEQYERDGFLTFPGLFTQGLMPDRQL